MACVVFTGGGTGGHIFPGAAVADILKHQEKIRIVWIGGAKGSDENFLKPYGIEFKGIPAGKFRRYFSFKNFIDIFKIIGGFFASLFILIKLKPDAVFSKGGFVSVPPCAAAKFLHIPVVTHECDYSPGLATKINARFAKLILISYPDTANFFKSKYKDKIICTGNPVRKEFYNADAENGKKFFSYEGGKPVLLVLGGSLGAAQINNLVEENIKFLLENFFVVHQTGEANISAAENLLKDLQKNFPSLAKNYKPFAFIKKEMPDVLAASSIVVSRAGANTVWETSALGKPMILIPLDKGSSRGDQIENAEFFFKNNAALVLKGKEADSSNFKTVLKNLLEDKDKCKNLSAEAKKFTEKNTAAAIAEILKTFICNGV